MKFKKNPKNPLKNVASSRNLRQRILGIDYGDKRIGLAISDDQSMFAMPFLTIENTSQKQVKKQLRDICEKKNIDTIVIGFPLTLQNEHSEQTKKVLEFKKKIEEKLLNVKIILQDERFSTREAKAILKNKKGNIDESSAVIILQTYLDRR